MVKLFETTKIKTLELKNRFVRSATWEGMAHDNGASSHRLIELMVALAKGGVGLIISSHSYVSPEGQAGQWQLGIYSDELISGFAELTTAVHEHGGKIIMQLAHAGCHAPVELIGQQAFGPSAFITDPAGPPCKEMTVSEIQQTVDAFGRGAFRAQKAGFDGVQIHAAHGYLLSQFLSPFYNKRTDDYGGNIANRSRIVFEVLQSIRSNTGSNFPIFIKINSEDFIQSGMTVPEMLTVSRHLQDSGIDAIEMSGGTKFSGKQNPIRSGKTGPGKEVFYKDAAVAYKRKISVPLVLVGGIRSYDVAEKLLKDGIADYISLCRPLIREPALINRWQTGDMRRSTCRSDNLCFKPARAGKGIYCVREEIEKRRSLD